mgnify:CR=1 FL=1
MSYNSLNKFTKDLINNTINSAKTTDIALNISYEDFKKYNEEQKQYNAHLIEEYMKNHDLPRKEQLSTYNTYLTDKANLKSEYNKTKELIIDLTRHLDVIENLYNNVNEELKKRTKI